MWNELLPSVREAIPEAVMQVLKEFPFFEPFLQCDLLIHGSVARLEADAYSDLDLFGVREAGEEITEVVTTPYGHIDFYLTTYDLLQSHVTRHNDGSRNFQLNALAGALIVRDPLKRLGPWVDKAERLRQAPPPPLDPIRALLLSRSLRQLYLSLASLAARADRSRTDQFLFQMRANQMFVLLTSWYSEAARIWCPSFRDMARQFTVLYPRLRNSGSRILKQKFPLSRSSLWGSSTPGCVK